MSAEDDTRWMLAGSCVGYEKDLWFPSEHENRGRPRGARTADPWASARAVCDRCLVSTDCLDYAVAHGIRFGMWGGTTPETRRHMLKARP